MYIIDRIENGVVVVETPHGFINIDSSRILGEFREGSVLIKKGDTFLVDTRETQDRRRKLADLQNSLFDE